MRITTWNVNGIRNPFSYQPWSTARTFSAMFDILEADIVVMQELKIQRKDLRDDMVLLDGWDCYFSLPKHKKGYSGVGIYTRNATCCPIRAEEGLLGVLCPPASNTAYRDLPSASSIGGYPSLLDITDLGVDPVALDAEGRCVVLEFPAFVLFGIYSPANSNGLRDDFRFAFLSALDCRVRNLIRAGKRVIVTGDLNVSREEIDTASAIDDIKKAGMTHEEYVNTPNRRIFNQLLLGGDVVGERDAGREETVMWDVCRGFHEGRKGMYTHWEQKINARPGNYGSRIDYVLCSADMREWFQDSNIQEGLMGSDHCPVYAVLNDTITISASDASPRHVQLLDIMNPLGYFFEGKRRKDWSVKEIPAFSAKLLPEFDKRRSIKDMFTKKPVPKAIAGDPKPASQSESSQHETATFPGPQAAPATAHHVTDSADDGTPGPEAAPGSQVDIRKSSGKKRKSFETDPVQHVKRQKSGASSSTTSTSESAKGQQSLKGFFKPKSPAPTRPTDEPRLNDDHVTANPPATPSHESVQDELYSVALAQTIAASLASTASPRTPPPFSPPSTTNNPRSPSLSPATAAKSSWSSLFTKPRPPVCEGHSEPCKRMLTRKKGENQGRWFWMCARPLGPSGGKEKGTQWRCGTFVWCSDVGRNGEG
ncbi:Class II abasic (AP) endonuclease [Elasticomyces elasticus]|nr:Class II abasic (AP) endonuclease [Elasticomyces elasticus]